MIGMLAFTAAVFAVLLLIALGLLGEQEKIVNNLLELTQRQQETNEEAGKLIKRQQETIERLKQQRVVQWAKPIMAVDETIWHN